MIEFKVGDKVRLTGRGWGDDDSPARSGIVEIAGYSEDAHAFYFQDGGDNWYVWEDGDWGVELVYAEAIKELGVDPVEEGDRVKPVVELSPESLKMLADAARVNIESPDAIDPNYYKFPGGVEVRQISAHLTGFGAQALQYIARSTRLDGNNKGDQIENLRKSIRFIEWEIERLEGQA